MPRVNADRFIEAAQTATSATEGPDPTLCPRCQRPLMDPFGLGLCSACGYCHSLQTSRAASTSKRTAGPQREGTLTALKTLPRWAVILVGGAIAIVVLSLAAGQLLSSTSAVTLGLVLVEGLLGVVLVGWGHYTAVQLLRDLEPEPPVARTEKHTSAALTFDSEATQTETKLPTYLNLNEATAVLAEKIPVAKLKRPSLLAWAPAWRAVIAGLPTTRLQLYAVAWGACLVVGAGLVWLPYVAAAEERQSVEEKLLVEQSVKDKKSDQKGKEVSRTSSQLQRYQGQSPAASGTRTNPKNPEPAPIGIGGGPKKPPKPPSNDSRPTVACVIVGYQTNSSKQLTGLVVAALQDGKLTYVGEVQTGLDLEQRIALQLRLDGLKRNEPLLDIANVQAVWVKPEVYCEIHHSGISDRGGLSFPAFKGVLDP